MFLFCKKINIAKFREYTLELSMRKTERNTSFINASVQRSFILEIQDIQTRFFVFLKGAINNMNKIF